MGTWDDGLYDNDHALDVLPEMTQGIDLDKSPAHLSVGVGLRLWMASSSFDTHSDEVRAAIHRHEGWLLELPEDAREELREIADDPKAVCERRGSRTPEDRAVLGTYNEGPRVDALFRVPGADAVIRDVAERCMAHLDELTRHEDADLYEVAGDLAPLGVLLEMRAVGVRVPRAKVKAWQAAFKRMDETTDAERSFWDKYVTRVKKGFARLASA
jgi:hypothetical protein